MPYILISMVKRAIEELTVLITTQKANHPHPALHYMRHLILLALLALAPVQPSLAQPATDPTTQAQALYTAGKIPEALAAYEKIVDRSKQTQNRLGELQALIAIGTIHREQQQPKKAIPILEDATTRLNEADASEASFKLIGLLGLGRIYADLGDNTRALDYYQRTLKLSEKKGDRSIHATILNNIGTVYVVQGDYPKASEIFQSGLRVVQQAQHTYRDPITLSNLIQKCATAKAQAKSKEIDAIQKLMADFCGRGLTPAQLVDSFEKLRSQYMTQTLVLEQRSLNNLALVYSRQGDYQTAIQYHEQSNTISKRGNNKSDIATSLNNLGNIYVNLGNYPKALTLYQESQTISESISDRIQLSRTIGNIGYLYTEKGDYSKALEQHKKSLTIALETGDLEQQATLHNNIGTNHQYLSNYNAANDAYGQSLVIYRKTGSKPGIATTTNNIGVLQSTRGDYLAAEATLKDALQQAQTLNSPQLIAMTYGNLAQLYSDRGQYAKALDFYNNALQIQRKTGDRPNETASLLQFGSLYRLLGRPTKAQDYCKQSFTLAQSIGTKSLEALALGCLSGIALDQTRYPESNTLIQQALTSNRSIGNRRSEIQNLHTLGRLLTATQKHAEAETIFTQALTLAQTLGLKPEEGELLNALGTSQRSLNKTSVAQTSFKQSIVIADALGDRATSGKAQTNLGQSLIQSQRYAEAETVLSAAITRWESTRPGLTDSNKVSLFEVQSQTYALLQSALIAQQKIESALEISERGRARAFVELLASKGRSSAMLIASPTASPTIAEIRSIAKAQNATLVQYATVSTTELYIWVIKPDGTVHFAIRTLPQPLSKMVLENREAMGIRGRASITIEGPDSASVSDTNSNDRSIGATLQQLHQILIDPIQTHLPIDPEANVIFIPQDALFLVPFSALTNAQNTSLINRHTLTTAPSIQALALTQQLKKPKRSPSPLIVGNPTMPTYQGTPLDALPGAETEAKQIAQLFNATPLIGSQATKTTVLKRIQNATLIHLATHGILDTLRGDIPGAIALTPNSLTPSTQNDGFLTASELVDLKLTADLVVLSACSTGRGDITGDGVIGLSRSLFIAGVPSVIVSLWNVRDESTALLMTEFYKNLTLRNLTKAQALRQAMLTTQKTYPKPADWAAFNLVGAAQ